MHSPPTPSYRQLLIFWLPLLGTWLMMAVEGPFLSAIIARMVEPKFNLAAYGVAFSIALLVEAPIIMLTSASTRLVNNYTSYLRLSRFAAAFNLSVTLFMALVIVPPIYDLLAYDLIGLEPKVAQLTYYACLVLLPWPGAIGYRRFYQGILIRFDRTRLVAYGTVLRLMGMGLTALLLYHFSSLPGVLVGAIALSAGVVAEALMTRLMVIPTLAKIRRLPASTQAEMDYKSLFYFYLPLALSPFIGMGITPVITFFLSQGKLPLASLAVYPVIHFLVFIFRSPALSYQEVVISYLNEQPGSLSVLSRFATLMGLIVSALLGLMAFTPLVDLYFQGFTDLSEDLSRLAILPTQILILLPALSVLLAFQRAVLISAKMNRFITIATALELSSIAVTLYLGIGYWNMVGINAAGLALVLGRICSTSYLLPPFLRARAVVGH